MAMLEGGIAGAIVGGLSFMAGVGTAAVGFGKAVQGLVKFGVEVAWDMSQGATLEEAVGYNLLFNGIGKIVGLAAKKGANLVGTIWKATGGDAIVRSGMKAMRGLVKGVDNAVRNSRAGQSLGDALNQCKNSFSADTLVATEDGGVPISEIEVGDEVLAYDEATGEVGEYTVTDTIHHTDPEIVLLTISGEKLQTTLEHPFYTDDGEWVNAGELTVGENILSLDGDYGTVESVEIVTVSQAMYNLDVEIVDTFAVGDGEWVVHNQNCFVPKNALGNIGYANDTRAWNRATLQLYNPDGHTFFSGVYHLDTGRWLAYPSGNTKLASGHTPSILVNRYGGHREVWHSWSEFDPFIPPRNGLWDPPVESGLVGFTLPYTSTDSFVIRFRSVSINASSWGSQEAPPLVKVFKNFLSHPGEWVFPREQVIDALTGDLGLPITYIPHSLDG